MASILSTNNLAPNYFPKQKVSTAKKTDKFFKENIDAGVQLSGWQTGSTLRTKKGEMKRNYELMSNKVHPDEMKAVVNPFRIQGFDPTVNYQNYPLINSNLAVLVGEEIKRPFRPIVTVLNSDIVSENLKTINDEFMNFMLQGIQEREFNQAEFEEKVRNFDNWKNFTYRDKRSSMATQMIQYFTNTLELKSLFSKGFEDLMIASEEIFIIDIVSGEPVVRRGNPLNFTVVRAGESYKIEDADIIIEDGYRPIGAIIDEYHEYLSDTDIKKLEDSGKKVSQNPKMLFRDQLLNGPINYDDYIEKEYGGMGGLLVHTNSGNRNQHGAFDEDGNARVVRVVWRGMRKIGFVTSYDDEGNEIVKYVDEKYEVQKDLGEIVKWHWINEWLEGTRIADDIYAKMQPREVQFRTMTNPSRCQPGIIGTMFNINDSRSQSFVEFLKPYQLTFNAFMHTLKKAFAKHRGNMPVLNTSLIPDGWTMDQFMFYAEEIGWVVQDPFNEGKKGAALGKLAGNIGQTQSTINSDQTSIIQSTLVMLNFLKNFIDEASGITPQRKGAIDNRETLGGVEIARSQSSLNTEKYFSLHDDTKVRVVRALVETAKIAWKDKKFRRSFVLDDMSQGILDFDGQSFLESDYGIYISISAEHQDMFRNLRTLAQAFMQNGGTMSMVASLYNTNDPAVLQRKLEQFEESMRASQENARKEELEVQKQAIQQKEFNDSEIRRIAEEKNVRDAEVEIYKANLKESVESQEPIEVANELDKLEFDKEKHEDDVRLRDKDLDEKTRHNKVAEKISAKAKSTPAKSK